MQLCKPLMLEKSFNLKEYPVGDKSGNFLNKN